MSNLVKTCEFSPALPSEIRTYGKPIRCDFGFWNWNHSAFITDAVGYGASNAEAEIWARKSYEDEMRRPHFPEDALGLGELNS